jgi:shikimate dehydrogenase
MIRAGLIGHPLGHSKSPELFQKIFEKHGLTDARYELFPIEKADQLKKIVSNHPHLLGLNVTIPHKISILKQLDELSEEARAIGSVNTIEIIRSHDQFKLKGHNTDAEGFRKMMQEYLREKPDGAMILGSGGVAKSVKYVLQKENIPCLIASRTATNDLVHYDNLNTTHFRDYPLIINCTPLGMWPDIKAAPPLPFQEISEGNIVFELIYNPPKTKLMQEASRRGAKAYNGMVMLQSQAFAAWDIWKKSL